MGFQEDNPVETGSWEIVAAGRRAVGGSGAAETGVAETGAAEIGTAGGSPSTTWWWDEEALNYVKRGFIILVHYVSKTCSNCRLCASRSYHENRPRLASSTKSSAFAFRTTLAQTSHKKTWSAI